MTPTWRPVWLHDLSEQWSKSGAQDRDRQRRPRWNKSLSPVVYAPTAGLQSGRYDIPAGCLSIPSLDRRLVDVGAPAKGQQRPARFLNIGETRGRRTDSRYTNGPTVYISDVDCDINVGASMFPLLPSNIAIRFSLRRKAVWRWDSTRSAIEEFWTWVLLNFVSLYCYRC